MINLIKRERLLAASNIAVMTITFLVFGAFISIVAFSQTALRTLEKQAQITLFFKDTFTEESILNLKKELETDERISEIQYISKTQAFEIFTEINKNDPLLLESISADILPASLEIRTKNIKDLSVFAQNLNSLEGVEEVKFFKDVVEQFKKWSNIAYSVGFALVIIFLVISFAVVIVTLRLTINSKGTELEILKLVGASDDYVKKPLIRLGVFFGVSSALIASIILLLAIVIVQVTGSFGGYIEFAFLPNFLINLNVFGVSLSFILILSGFLLGYLGSQAAIKKYLQY